MNEGLRFRPSLALHKAYRLLKLSRLTDSTIDKYLGNNIIFLSSLRNEFK